MPVEERAPPQRLDEAPQDGVLARAVGAVAQDAEPGEERLAFAQQDAELDLVEHPVARREPADAFVVRELVQLHHPVSLSPFGAKRIPMGEPRRPADDLVEVRAVGPRIVAASPDELDREPLVAWREAVRA